MLRSLLARLRHGSGESDAGNQPTDAEPSDDDPVAGDPGEGEEDGPSNPVWDLIPGWQYDGRHVESGGMSRGEQEQAIRDVQRQAAEIEHDGEDGSGHEQPDADQ